MKADLNQSLQFPRIELSPKPLSSEMLIRNFSDDGSFFSAEKKVSFCSIRNFDFHSERNQTLNSSIQIDLDIRKYSTSWEKNLGDIVVVVVVVIRGGGGTAVSRKEKAAEKKIMLGRKKFAIKFSSGEMETN